MGTTTSTTTVSTVSTPPPPPAPAFYFGFFGTFGYFVTVFVIYIAIYSAKFGSVIENIKEEPALKPEYDYIIVGGGSAGCVLAARLSEDPTVTVLLLESGTQQTAVSQVPLLVQYLQGTDEDWQLKSEPLPNLGRSLNNNSIKYVQGKSLGGSSNLNYMMYTRGNQHDYDYWESLGNDGWGWADVLPYFLKSEQNRNSTLATTKYHNATGAMSVEDLIYKTPMADLYLKAGKEFGYPNVDVNGARMTGFANPQITTFNGSRMGTSRSFLVPVANRTNLHISMQTNGTKIIIDPVTKKVTGVEMIRAGIKRIVNVKKEAIVSAGALQTPKLLMLSGVGPKSELDKFGIPVIKDLPVGQNLNDHVTTAGLNFLIGKPWGYVQGQIFANATPMLEDYFKNSSGVLTSPGTVEAMAFLNTKYANTSIDYPDVEFIISSGCIPADGGTQLRYNFNLKDDFYNTVYKPREQYYCFTICPVLLRPKSRGNVTLRSTNFNDAPVITPNYFADPEDMKVMIEAVKMALQYAKTKSLYDIGTIFWPIKFPNCQNFTVGSDEMAECYVREFPATFWHFSGTAKMGPVSDPTAVVDNRLRVHGITGLRVVDNSIMPKVISAHTNAPAIMIGEKAADMIKQDNQ